jgi:hypothetical protein
MTILCDPELLNEAQRLGLHHTKKETLNSALQAYIEKCKRKAVLEAFGSFDFDETYDYKKAREKR